jgi:hypothetical protein
VPFQKLAAQMTNFSHVIEFEVGQRATKTSMLLNKTRPKNGVVGLSGQL